MEWSYEVLQIQTRFLPYFVFSRETIIPSVISSSEKMNSHSFYLLVSLTLQRSRLEGIPSQQSKKYPFCKVVLLYCSYHVIIVQQNSKSYPEVVLFSDGYLVMHSHTHYAITITHSGDRTSNCPE